jgi:hypothetical protein
VVGLQQTGVAACAKHFPGHGATVTDSHLELPVVDVTLDTLHSRELPPFSAVVAADAKAIMTAHIRVPALTGDEPATFSRRALVDLLRRDLRFTGVVVTDALEMQGAAPRGVPAAAVRSLAAAPACFNTSARRRCPPGQAVWRRSPSGTDARLGITASKAASAALVPGRSGTRGEVDPHLGY